MQTQTQVCKPCAEPAREQTFAWRKLLRRKGAIEFYQQLCMVAHRKHSTIHKSWEFLTSLQHSITFYQTNKRQQQRRRRTRHQLQIWHKHKACAFSFYTKQLLLPSHLPRMNSIVSPLLDAERLPNHTPTHTQTVVCCTKTKTKTKNRLNSRTFREQYIVYPLHSNFFCVAFTGILVL
jgi:hypothetical protein